MYLQSHLNYNTNFQLMKSRNLCTCLKQISCWSTVMKSKGEKVKRCTLCVCESESEREDIQIYNLQIYKYTI